MGKIVTAWDQNMRPYYHFTSLDSCEKIINTGNMRLSPCNMIKNIAVETMGLYSELEHILKSDTYLMDCLLKLFNQQQNSSLIDFLIRDRNKSYISCFSMFDEHNEIVLAKDARYMWKFYANDSNGVAIKFNYKCFPYFKHSTTSEQDANGNFHRVTEMRMDQVTYDSDKLKEQLYQCVNWDMKQHIFATDVSKPKFCKLEQEIRFLVYVADRNELNRLPGISESSSSSNELPKYLYYDFSAQETNETGVAIQKIFCRTEETRAILVRILDEDRVDLI